GIPERIINGTTGWVISVIIGLLLIIFATVIIIKVSKVAKDSFVPNFVVFLRVLCVFAVRFFLC
ncbi:MAG: hypothetical protein P8Y30_05265, partial [candidate division WOR-3 bacterium]